MEVQGKRWDRLWLGAHLATLADESSGYGEVLDGALATRRGRIAWTGPAADLPGDPECLAEEVIELGGRWITPGLVDCHTHLVFAGERSHEFEARLAGISYEELLRQGGGIQATMRATREATEDSLFDSARERMRELQRAGVTTVEVKSGYGLELEAELKMLRVARRLGSQEGVDVQATFLGAHVVPPEYLGRREAYVEEILHGMLPAVVEEGLADAVDAFCEGIAFTPADCRAVLSEGRRLGLAGHLHADQLTDQGGASLAAELGALSADHLERSAEEGIREMGAAGVTAVLLPGAFYYLCDDHPPPTGVMRASGVPMAVATDLNPGSSPVCSPLVAMNLACVLFGLTPEEALRGMTRNGARALGLAEDRGSLEPGKRADLAIWEVGHPRELSYWVGRNPCVGVVKDGEVVPL